MAVGSIGNLEADLEFVAKELKKRHGRQLMSVARRAGVSQATVYQLRKGLSNGRGVNYHTFRALERVLREGDAEL